MEKHHVRCRRCRYWRGGCLLGLNARDKHCAEFHIYRKKAFKLAVYCPECGHTETVYPFRGFYPFCPNCYGVVLRPCPHQPSEVIK
jgi:ribosomal protein S27E